MQSIVTQIPIAWEAESWHLHRISCTMQIVNLEWFTYFVLVSDRCPHSHPLPRTNWTT